MILMDNVWIETLISLVIDHFVISLLSDYTG